jgi:hypothetical protein
MRASSSSAKTTLASVCQLIMRIGHEEQTVIP